MKTPSNVQFVEVYEKLQLYSDEIKGLPLEPGIEEVIIPVTSSLKILSEIISEGFNLPELYDSPEYKHRMMVACTPIYTCFLTSHFIKVLDEQKYTYLREKLSGIMLPVINSELP